MNLLLNRKNINSYALIAAVFIMVTLIVIASYDNILKLTNNIGYVIFPSRKVAEYERLTTELVALYGSGQIEYYRQSQNEGKSVARAYTNQDDSNNDTIVGSIYIPSIKVEAPIVLGSSTDERTVLKQLKNGVLMYPGSASPGSGGSTVIIGHSSSNFPWQKYASVFSALPDLSEGDMIIINYNDKKYAYNVVSKITGSVSALANANIDGDLIVGSCWPIGTDEQRILITASLVSST